MASKIRFTIFGVVILAMLVVANADSPTDAPTAAPTDAPTDESTQEQTDPTMEHTASPSATTTTVSPTSGLTTTPPSTTTGALSLPSRSQCVGNDSRCGGTRTRANCQKLKRQGADCVWEVAYGFPGECQGNDSRCSGSWKATCKRLRRQGADCRWKNVYTGPPGKCLGNDSRCHASSTHSLCTFVHSQGASCKWRDVFSITGELRLDTSNAHTFIQDASVKNAIRAGLGYVTSVGTAYIEVDLFSLDGRRLTSLRRLDAIVTVTYSIDVGGDAPASISVTSSEVAGSLDSANSAAIEDALTTEIQNAKPKQYNVQVAGVDAPSTELFGVTGGDINATEPATSTSAPSSTLPTLVPSTPTASTTPSILGTNGTENSTTTLPTGTVLEVSSTLVATSSFTTSSSAGLSTRTSSTVLLTSTGPSSFMTSNSAGLSTGTSSKVLLTTTGQYPETEASRSPSYARLCLSYAVIWIVLFFGGDGAFSGAGA